MWKMLAVKPREGEPASLGQTDFTRRVPTVQTLSCNVKGSTVPCRKLFFLFLSINKEDMNFINNSHSYKECCLLLITILYLVASSQSLAAITSHLKKDLKHCISSVHCYTYKTGDCCNNGLSREKSSSLKIESFKAIIFFRTS